MFLEKIKNLHGVPKKVNWLFSDYPYIKTNNKFQVTYSQIPFQYPPIRHFVIYKKKKAL